MVGLGCKYSHLGSQVVITFAVVHTIVIIGSIHTNLVTHTYTRAYNRDPSNAAT